MHEKMSQVRSFGMRGIKSTKVVNAQEASSIGVCEFRNMRTSLYFHIYRCIPANYLHGKQFCSIQMDALCDVGSEYTGTSIFVRGTRFDGLSITLVDTQRYARFVFSSLHTFRETSSGCELCPHPGQIDR